VWRLVELAAAVRGESESGETMKFVSNSGHIVQILVLKVKLKSDEIKLNKNLFYFF
jgi:hypothetical protein